jgi:hypothetical protein
MSNWEVWFHTEFEAEVGDLPEAVRDELYARLEVLREFGPQTGRPNVDTLQGSKFRKMKELRFQLDGLWRFAFAFDSESRAIVLVGGNKEGEKSGRFYRWLIRVADERFTAHIAALEKTG